MQKLLAFVFAICLWFNFAPPAAADVAGLVPCGESPAFQQRAAAARNTTNDPESGKKRFDRYAQALCGAEDGLPRLIVDGRLSHAGDFLIPSILFLYIAGWIGWVGRMYIIAIKKGDNPEYKEVVIDVPLAVSCMLSGFAWPASALGEFTSGKLLAKDTEITVSPR